MTKKTKTEDTVSQSVSQLVTPHTEMNLTRNGPDKEAVEPVGSSSTIPVIGMGGSAGSLEAFKTFFTTMPADSGAAFVVIQHLAPTHVSLLAELLAQHTRMKVV